MLHHLSHFQPIPWLCVGDFNEIVDLLEKKGAVSRAKGQMEDFQYALMDYRLHDLGLTG